MRCNGGFALGHGLDWDGSEGAGHGDLEGLALR
jgi:hypothetical protein